VGLLLIHEWSCQGAFLCMFSSTKRSSRTAATGPAAGAPSPAISVFENCSPHRRHRRQRAMRSRRRRPTRPVCCWITNSIGSRVLSRPALVGSMRFATLTNRFTGNLGVTFRHLLGDAVRSYKLLRFQVTRFPAPLSAGMHGTERRN
jgi:hypothetical protein